MINDDPQVEAKKKHLRVEMMLKDSDIKRLTRSITELEMRMSDLKRKKTQLETEFTQVENMYKKMQADQLVLQNELKHMKLTLNQL